MLDKQRIVSKITKHEGCISHMYKDTADYVTVGVGQLLRTVEDAKKLPFVLNTTREAASPAQIAIDFQQVSDAPKGLIAQRYEKYTQLILLHDDIDHLLVSRIGEFNQGLEQSYNGFSNFPDSAQEALLDMAFNLGIKGLTSKFKKLSIAVNNQDWLMCAKECNRRGISDERNTETRKLFEHAQAVHQ